MKLLELTLFKKRKENKTKAPPQKNPTVLLFNCYLENWKPCGNKGSYFFAHHWLGVELIIVFLKKNDLPNSLSALASVTIDPESQKAFQDQVTKHLQLQAWSLPSPGDGSSKPTLAGTLAASDDIVLPNANLAHFWKVLLLLFFCLSSIWNSSTQYG